MDDSKGPGQIGSPLECDFIQYHTMLYDALKCFLGRLLTMFCNRPIVLILLNGFKG